MLRASPWWAVIGCAGVLVGAPTVFAQEAAIDIDNTLRNLSLEQAARQSRLPVVSPAASEPFILLGVVIAEDRRLALLQPAQAADAAQLVPLGGSLEGHRLIDVQLDHVTLEGRGGDRFLVRLASGHDARGAAPSTPATPAARLDGAKEFDERSRAAKEERRRQIDDRTARDKARALAERFLSGGASPAPTNP